mmetsp:Transcript_52357/g.126675  ORF Transcript_52357/g.126675 Transcript_52357/m.126675 type:complete len:1127 (+) Transcript_52357:212-3592(+)
MTTATANANAKNCDGGDDVDVYGQNSAAGDRPAVEPSSSSAAARDNSKTSALPDQDKEESSSTGSDGGKGSGSGSGGGYSADCSSSDTSSVGNGKGGGSGSSGEGEGDADEAMSSSRDPPGAAMNRLRIGDSSVGETAMMKTSKGLHEQDVDDGDRKPAALPSSKSNKARSSDHYHPSQAQREDRKKKSSASAEAAAHGGSGNAGSASRRSSNKWKVVQWNGVTVKHPMDPRIDLSTVGYVKLPTNAGNDAASGLQLTNEDQAALEYAQKLGSGGQTGSSETGSSSDQNNLSSIDQYMKLMESVRPFFNAHGLSHDGSRAQPEQAQSSSSSDIFSSEFASTGPSDSDQKPHAAAAAAAVTAAAAGDTAPSGRTSNMKDPPRADGNLLQDEANESKTHPGDKSQGRGGEDDDSDSSSMVVLARAKRKHTRSHGDDGEGTQNGSSATTNTNGGSTVHSSHSGSSSSLSEERHVRIQQPRNPPEEQAAGVDDVAVNNDAPADMEVEAEANNANQPEAPMRPHGPAAGDAGVDRQESTSSSSDDRNNQPPPERARFGVPAMVSEYSSSARNSGGSKTNGMSTSGSGSGGNTGSGTGSGSNQGGSSGSGNDQGGISSNGNGSSGSGNDLKGSSEEKEDNTGENNSGENSAANSDVSNPAKASGVKAVPEVPTVNPSGLEAFLHRHHHRDDVTGASDQHAFSDRPEDQSAAREKKIQDKKRKRMNMRREYEEKVEEEMASSESSRDHEIVLRPGKPVTLDKVLSFTKTPRLVAKAEPPFLVVYTNAAYSRLSGIDSHSAVGKPISTLLSILDQYELSQLDVENDLSASQESPSKRLAKDPENRDRDVSSNVGDDREHYVAAAAAGRAAALAAPTGDASSIGIDTLVVNSGFGRLNLVTVRSKMHHMVGRNIKVLKSTAPVKKNPGREEGSNDGSSITSNFDGPLHSVACTMCVSPVVSSPEAYHVVTDKDQSSHHHKNKRSEKDHDSHQHKNKRRKHHHHPHFETSQHVHLPHRHPHMMKEIAIHHRPQLVSHYVIELEPYDKDRANAGMMESSTSASFEARKLGLSKTELAHQRSKEEFQPAPPAAAAAADSADLHQGHSQANDEYDDDVDLDEDEVQTEESETPHVSAIG